MHRSSSLLLVKLLVLIYDSDGFERQPHRESSTFGKLSNRMGNYISQVAEKKRMCVNDNKFLFQLKTIYKRKFIADMYCADI